MTGHQDARAVAQIADGMERPDGVSSAARTPPALDR
jgi:hypothetical protein